MSISTHDNSDVDPTALNLPPDPIDTCHVDTSSSEQRLQNYNACASALQSATARLQHNHATDQEVQHLLVQTRITPTHATIQFGTEPQAVHPIISQTTQYPSQRITPPPAVTNPKSNRQPHDPDSEVSHRWYYAVRVGLNGPTIHESWPACAKDVLHPQKKLPFTWAQFRGFDSISDAIAYTYNGY